MCLCAFVYVYVSLVTFDKKKLDIFSLHPTATRNDNTFAPVLDRLPTVSVFVLFKQHTETGRHC